MPAMPCCGWATPWDYRLTLTLNESNTGDVVLTDTLPAGLAFEQIVSVNGDSAAPFDPVLPRSGHTPVADPDHQR